MNTLFSLAASTSAKAEEALHVGHDHGFFGEWVEHILDKAPLSTPFSEFLNHLIVDTVQVFFLLIVIMTTVYFVTSYFNIEKLHHKLASLKSIWGFLLAGFIGAITPFCSCSTIPVLMGFLSMGVPVSVCLCYLTASSMLNLTAIISLFALTDLSFGISYLIFAILIIIVSSVIFSVFKLDRDAKHYHVHDHHEHDGCETILGRLKNAWNDTMSVFKKCVIWVILGVTLSSGIMAFFSVESIGALVDANGILSTTVVTLVGIPIHSDIFSIAPLIKLFLNISPSLALTFAVSTMAISLPSVIILTRALKTKTVLTYCGVIAGLTLVFGYMAMLIF